MRTYIAHSMDGNEKLLVSLEMVKSEVDVAQKLAEEGAYLLRKDDEENETYQAEACQLDEEKATMAIEKEKTKEKFTRLRQELQDLQARFATQNEDLEADYQKQVDDMFFYSYWCCIKKHDIANDTSSFPFDDEEDEFLGSPTQENGHALGDGPSTRDDFPSEWV